MLYKIFLRLAYGLSVFIFAHINTVYAEGVSGVQTLALTGFELPETVLHDPQNDVYLVSNIAGNIPDKDDNGFISKVSPDGKMLALKWIDGASEEVTLHSPKGMVIYEQRLFVADIDTVRIFDKNTGEYKGAIPIEGTTFLNDIIVDDNGNLYVSDSAIQFVEGAFKATKQDAVYQVSSNGIVRKFAQNIELNQPNGLELIGSDIGVVTRGAADFYRLDTQGNKQRIMSLPGKILDGLVESKTGEYWVSSWQTSSLYQINDKGAVMTEIKLPVPAANIGFDKKRQRLLLPLLKRNQIAFLKVK